MEVKLTSTAGKPAVLQRSCLHQARYLAEAEGHCCRGVVAEAGQHQVAEAAVHQMAAEGHIHPERERQ